MIETICRGLLIPFLGTAMGASCSLFMKKEMNRALSQGLTGFAAGVMVAASVWSLLLPAIDRSTQLAQWAFLPAGVGFCVGILFLSVLEKLSPKVQSQNSTGMLVLAVVLHNIPEGLAVGVVYASLLKEQTQSLTSTALMLSVGIGIQNFPEGAIVSMPLASQGVKKQKAFLYGVLSGVVEPIAGMLTLLLFSLVTTALPVLLGFAAGAMIYVVMKELAPEMSGQWGMQWFMIGFVVMMALDVALG